MNNTHRASSSYPTCGRRPDTKANPLPKVVQTLLVGVMIGIVGLFAIAVVIALVDVIDLMWSARS